VTAGLSSSAFVLALIAVGVGGVVQGSIGFGFSLVAAPVLALVHPEALPATLLLLGVPLNVFTTIRERRCIDLRGLTSVLGGRVIGAVAGAGILVVVPARFLSTLFGVLILLAVVLSALRPGFRPRQRLRFVAGVASGIMATGAAVGGPALALVYQDRQGAVLRSTLAVFFLFGLAVSLAALTVAGKITASQVALSLRLLPALVIGLAASGTVARLVDRRSLRPAVLAFSFVSASAAILKGIIG
jgi:uncharacterized membrane protein YfcA